MDRCFKAGHWPALLPGHWPALLPGHWPALLLGFDPKAKAEESKHG